MPVPVTVLVVDDSAVIRGLVTKALTTDPAIAVVGSAANGAMAIGMAKELRPNIIILDIEMPVMDGITALPELVKVSPTSRIIIASTLSVRNAEISLKALSLGATDYLAKPSSKAASDVDHFYTELTQKVKTLGQGEAKRAPAFLPPAVARSASAPAVPHAPARPVATQNSDIPLHRIGVKALAIASSTGGPQALMTLFEHLKGHLAGIPIFITQHMPATFTTILAEHIAKAGARPCAEAKNGDAVEPGKAYLAPGDYHMVAEKSGLNVVLKINRDAPENFCRPAADPMLRSLSAIYGKHLAVVVLTGMGQDGMEGSKVVVAAGGSVIAQDEASSVVYGMPKAVAEQKLCRAILPLSEIGRYLITQIEGR